MNFTIISASFYTNWNENIHKKQYQKAYFSFTVKVKEEIFHYKTSAFEQEGKWHLNGIKHKSEKGRDIEKVIRNCPFCDQKMVWKTCEYMSDYREELLKQLLTHKDVRIRWLFKERNR